MSTSEHYVENPPHVDERRMRHIADADLFSALDLARPGLEAVRSAAVRADWATAYRAWKAYLAERQAPTLGVNTVGHLRRLQAFGSPRVAEILRAAEQLHAREVDFTDRAVGRSDLYHLNRLSWLTPLVEAYLLTGDDQHVRAFARLLNAWYDARDRAFGDWPGLDVNWYTLNLGMRSRLFCVACSALCASPALDELTLAHLLKSELGAGRWLAEEHARFRYGNWQFVGAACLLELASFWPEFSEAASWRNIAWERIFDHLALDVYPDGGHLERSPGYHHYPLGALCEVAPLLDPDAFRRLTQHPRFRAMFHWSLQHCTPLGCSTDFNDSGFVDCAPVAVRGAVLCADPECKWLAQHFGSPDDIATTLASIPALPDGRDPVQAFADLPSREPDLTSALLATSKFAILRRSLSPDSLYMAVSYGPFIGHELEPHSHYDPLSFVCFGHGAPLAIEAGGPRSYDELPTYYTWYQAACSHNLVLVDDRNPSQAKDARLLVWAPTPIADLFCAGHDGYRNVRHRRSILFVPDGYWVVFDQLAQSGRHPPDWIGGWQLYTPQPFTIQDGVLRPNAAPGLIVLPVGPCASAPVELIHGEMTVPGPRAYQGQHTRRDVQGFRRIIDSDQPAVSFTHVLFPCPPGDSLPTVQVSDLPALEGDVQAFTLATQRGEDLIALASTPWRTRGYASDAHTLLMRADGAWAGFGLASLRDATGELLFQASPAVHSVAIQPGQRALNGQIVARAKTIVRLAAPRSWLSVAINGIAVPQEEPGPQPCFQLPAEGSYTLRITLAP